MEFFIKYQSPPDFSSYEPEGAIRPSPVFILREPPSATLSNGSIPWGSIYFPSHDPANSQYDQDHSQSRDKVNAEKHLFQPDIQTKSG